MLICIGFTSTFARSKDSSYVKGIIITPEKKIECFVKSKESYCGKIKYELDYTSGKKHNIHSDEVIQIICSGKYFDNIQIDDKQYLLQRLCKGKISLYKRVEEEDNAPMYNAATGTSMSIGSQSESTFYIVVNEEVIKIDKKNYQEKVPPLFRDNPELMEKVRNLNPKDDNTIKKLQSLIYEYNRAI